MFLDRVNGHKSAMINYDPSHFLLQQMDYLAFIDLYHDRINAFHMKDAEFNPDGRRGGTQTTKTGQIELDVSALWATVKSILRRSSQNSPNMAMTAGQFWSGNVVSNQPNEGPPKARLLLPNI